MYYIRKYSAGYSYEVFILITYSYELSNGQCFLRSKNKYKHTLGGGWRLFHFSIVQVLFIYC